MWMANCGTDAKMMTFETMIAGVDQMVVSNPRECSVADHVVLSTRAQRDTRTHRMSEEQAREGRGSEAARGVRASAAGTL